MGLFDFIKKKPSTVELHEPVKENKVQKNDKNTNSENNGETPLTPDDSVDEVSLIESRVKNEGIPARETSSDENELVKVTRWLFYATVILALVAALQFAGTLKIADSNEKMTDITEIFYEYHPPNVTLIDGSFAKLYVLKQNGSNTEISVVGIASVYNSALSDDVALVKKNVYSTPYYPLSEAKFIFYIVNNTTGDIYSTTEVPIIINDTLFVEGNSFPLPVNPGSFTYIPIMLTIKSNSDVPLNKSINFTIDHNHTRFEVVHPTTKKQISNFSSCETSHITYIMGENIAHVTEITGREYIVDVRYTEDKEVYTEWKNIYLLQYGRGALVNV